MYMKHRLIKDIEVVNKGEDVKVTITKTKEHHLSNEEEEQTSYTVNCEKLKQVLEELIL